MTRRLAAATLACVLALGGGAVHAEGDGDLARYVDPFIGTLGAGFVFPGAAAPYGMVQLSPDTEGFFAYTGYMYSDAFIRGFRHVHIQSMGVPAGGNLPFMPTSGAVSSTDVRDYESTYNKLTEAAEPGYYRVDLLRYGIEAELTAGLRVGMHRYTFPAGQQANVLLDVGRQIPGGGTDVHRIPGTNRAWAKVVDERTVLGSSNIDRQAPHGYSVHFAARFDRPFVSHGVWESRGAVVQDGVDEVEGVGAGAVVSFDASEDREVLIKVGVSFVSPENALANLEAELPEEDFDFEALRARTYAAWNDALHAIVVEGGTDLDKRVFYTALYHAQHHPNVFNDVNGEYIGHDDEVYRIGDPGDPMPAGSTYYANFSMWDTYRAQMPLLMLIAPDRMRDMMRSINAIARTAGVMPRWALMNRNPNFMNGEPALQVIADAYCRGLVPDDVLDELYAEARRVALVDRRHAAYLENGWTTEASNTLEHANGDFALALMADALGEDADRDELREMADNWRNVFDVEETGFVRPRNSDGSWRTPYDPMMPDGFREGTGWQYTWLVSHDVRGLYDAMGEGRGGDDLVRRRLDTFFSTALTGTLPLVMPEVQQKLTLYGIAYYGNQYAPSNEHDLQAPWMYPWTSEPWKTQAIQRGYQTLYRPVPDGLPGNDDLGTLSSWYIWSALGFYPMIPGAPLYIVGSPAFERATIRLPDDEVIVVRAPGASLFDRYVQEAALGDEPLDRSWFTHADLVQAGEVTFEMGALPNLGLWGDADARPPSASTHPLDAFACSG